MLSEFHDESQGEVDNNGGAEGEERGVDEPQTDGGRGYTKLVP